MMVSLYGKVFHFHCSQGSKQIHYRSTIIKSPCFCIYCYAYLYILIHHGTILCQYHYCITLSDLIFFEISKTEFPRLVLYPTTMCWLQSHLFHHFTILAEKMLGEISAIGGHWCGKQGPWWAKKNTNEVSSWWTPLIDDNQACFRISKWFYWNFNIFSWEAWHEIDLFKIGLNNLQGDPWHVIKPLGQAWNRLPKSHRRVDITMTHICQNLVTITLLDLTAQSVWNDIWWWVKCGPSRSWWFLYYLNSCF